MVAKKNAESEKTDGGRRRLNETRSWVIPQKWSHRPSSFSAPAATHLHWVVKVACRLQEALEAVSLISRNSQDKQFFWKTKEKYTTNVSFMTTNQPTWM